jgi:hypothetical protein
VESDRLEDEVNEKKQQALQPKQFNTMQLTVKVSITDKALARFEFQNTNTGLLRRQQLLMMLLPATS